MPRIRVAIAEDDALFRAALVDVLEADPRFVLVAEAMGADEIVEAVARHAPDLVLLDVRMPGGGAAAAQAISKASPPGSGMERRSGPVLVALSAQAGTVSVLTMLRAGAIGYLVKGGVGADLPDLLVRSARGEVIIAAPGAAEAIRTLVGGAPEGA